MGREGQSQNRVLDLKALISIAIGYVIGSGIVTITGAAIAETGRSAWISTGGAVILGLLVIFPFVILGSVLRLHGGDYTMVMALLGKRMAGIFIMNFIIMNLAISLTVSAMGIYVNSLFPGLNPTVVSIVAAAFFFGVNLLGIEAMSSLQKLLSVLLIAGLLTFCIAGFMKLAPGTFALASPGYFASGSTGIINGMVMMLFATTLHQTLLNFGADAIDARRDIPKAILITSGIIFFIYLSIGLVAANVLPVSQVAGQPLTYVAREILPTPVFIFFMIGGPIGAIATTLNAIFSAASRPLLKAAEDGWFPESFAKRNRFGAPYLIMSVLLAVALFPILIGYNIATITNNTVLVQYIVKFILLTAIWQMPKKYPKEWEASWLHMPNPLFYTIMVVVYVTQAYIVYVSARNLTPTIVCVSIAVIIAAGAIAIVRDKMGKVSIDWDPQDLI